MTNKGQAEVALGAGLVFSAIGGLFGTAVLIVSAPTLAEFALKFSSFEYFWLVLMGLTCAVFLTSENPLKGFVSLFLGLLIASVGLNNPAGIPRFTFGNVELMGGIGLVPLMIGMFAISEIIRYAVDTNPQAMIVEQPIGNVFKGMWRLTVKYPVQILRGSALGTLVGALPGAGADIAAWMSYAVSKKFSKEPEKFGTGHVEGIVESGAANNSALAGAWIPALVFGIPGDFVLNLYEALSQDGRFQLVTFSHEPAVGFAADGASLVGPTQLLAVADQGWEAGIVEAPTMLAARLPTHPATHRHAGAQTGLPAQGYDLTMSDQGVGRVQVHVNSKGQASDGQHRNAQPRQSWETDFRSCNCGKCWRCQILQRQARTHPAEIREQAHVHIDCIFRVARLRSGCLQRVLNGFVRE